MHTRLALAASFLACSALLPATADAQARREKREAAREERAGNVAHIACVQSVSHSFGPGTVTIRVQLKDLPIIHFQQNALKVGGDSTRMSPAQANQWAMVVDTFRDAARQKVKVQLNYDKSDGEVNAAWARYDLPC
jgi:hypothetical protein